MFLNFDNHFRLLENFKNKTNFKLKTFYRYNSNNKKM